MRRLLTPLPAPSAMMLAQDVLEPASSGQASPTLNGGDTEKTLPQFPLSQASGASRSLVTGKPQTKSVPQTSPECSPAPSVSWRQVTSTRSHWNSHLLMLTTADFSLKGYTQSQVWWPTPLLPALSRQITAEFKTSLVYTASLNCIERPCLK